MGNMKFDGADVTFELDGYDALVERVRSKKVNCKINPSDLPRLYAVMDAELEGNEELAAAFAEAQEAAFGEAVLTVWANAVNGEMRLDPVMAAMVAAVTVRRAIPFGV